MSRYNKPPLVATWIAFGFDSSPDKTGWDLNLVEQFVRDHSEEFPKIESIGREELKIQPSTDGKLPRVTEKRETVDLVRMASKDGSRVRHLGDDRLAFNLLSAETDYLGFETLLAGGLEFLESYRNSFQPARVRDAGIHHTDIIEIPIEDSAVHIPDYFETIPDVPVVPFGYTIGFSFSFATKCPMDELPLSVKLNVIPPSQPQVLRIQLDWEKKCPGFEFGDLDAAKADLTSSHEYMVECFEAFVTDKTKSLFDPKN